MKVKTEKAIFSGELNIGDMVFPCSVLSDGTRILTQSDFMKGMNMYYSGWIAKEKTKTVATAEMPHFLAFKSLKPFIQKHLGDLQSISMRYKTEKGNLAHGIKAEIIPKICEVWLDADELGKLGRRQKIIAQKAKIIMRALAHIGIVALVDEATGYQEIRDREALQKILDKFITDEWAKWTKTFPDEFYRELFKLKGLSYPPRNGTKKPGYVGHWTNDIVYSRLAPGVLQKLKELTPRKPSGNRPRKFHQYLTRNYGIFELREHLSNVIFLMRGCSTWKDFKRLLERASPKYGDTMPLKLDDM